MLSITDILARKQPATRSVTFNLDGDETVTFTFRALGSQQWEALKAEHPPTKGQRADYLKLAKAQGINNPPGLAWDNDTFPPAALAACAVEPIMSVEDATVLWASDAFSYGDLATLWNECHMVNIAADLARQDAAGNGSGQTSTSDES